MSNSLETIENRRQGGRLLANMIANLGLLHPVVLALPRGGLGVAGPVASGLGAPLDVVLTQRVLSPQHQNTSIGAAMENGVILYERGNTYVDRVRATFPFEVQRERDSAMAMLELRREQFQASRPLPFFDMLKVIIVDDGIATGNSVIAAILFLQTLHAHKMIVATPVCDETAKARIEQQGARVISLITPTSDNFGAVAKWYDNFKDVSDTEAMNILRRHRRLRR